MNARKAFHYFGVRKLVHLMHPLFAQFWVQIVQQPSASCATMSLPPHMDVDVPPSLQSLMGSLLADFEAYLRRRGFGGTRVPKRDGGNHVTAWWLHVPLRAEAPTKSRVVYGETVHDAVNSTPHLWAQAKVDYRQEAVLLLREFMEARVRVVDKPPFASTTPANKPPSALAAVADKPPSALTAVADFHGWGEGYLSFRCGDAILPRRRPTDVEPEGWAYGLNLASGSVPGWYPPELVNTTLPALVI